MSPAVVEAARPKKRKREEVDGDYLVYRQVNFDELEEVRFVYAMCQDIMKSIIGICQSVY